MTPIFSLLDYPTAPSQPLEIVERKGRGHPDTICDALAEALSRALSQHYLDGFGTILHHNVDKGLLCGGRARAVFGGGEVLEPIDIFLAGRATAEAGGKKIPVEELAIETARDWLRANLRHIDPERHVRLHCYIRSGSAELTELFRRQKAAVPCANDTSCGVGYAPLGLLERLVLDAEAALNSPAAKAEAPAIGEDIKVMGLRHGSRIALTVASAMVCRHLPDFAAYRDVKALAAERVRIAAAGMGVELASVDVNAGDGETPDSLYLTETGTSAENGDDGEVGRGNRVNGLITFSRPMSMEAAAGKNPVNHVGKLYNLLAQRIATDLVNELEGVEEACCRLLGQIGRPIDDPQAVELALRPARGIRLEELQRDARDVAERHLAGVSGLWRELVLGELPLF